MSKSHSLTLAACVMGLCVPSAASAQQLTSAATAGPLRIKSAYNYPMKPCPGYENTEHGAPSWGEVQKVVRVVIRRGYDPNDPKRKVRHKPRESLPSDEQNGDASTANNDAGPGTRNDWNNVHDETHRPFHIDLQRFTPVVGKYVQIRVVLKDTNKFRFYGDGTNPEEVDIKGVGAGDTTNRLCGAHFIPNVTDKPPTVAFYTLMKSGAGYVDIPYNIGLVPLNDQATPLFIDPMIKNNG